MTELSFTAVCRNMIREGNKVGLGHLKVEMPVRCPSGDFQLAASSDSGIQGQDLGCR